MKGKTLKSIILAASAVGMIGLAGCGSQFKSVRPYEPIQMWDGTFRSSRDYHFKGKLVEKNEKGEIIKEEQVWFYETHHPEINMCCNILKVTKPDGRKIHYCDELKHDLKIESVMINFKDGNWKIYSTELEVSKPIIEEAQKQFDEYLRKILEYKQKEGLNNLK